MALTEAPPGADIPAAPARHFDPRRVLSTDGAALAYLAGAAALYYLAPGTALSVAGLLLFGAGAIRRPDLALAAIVAVLPLYYHPREWGRLQFAPSEALLLATTAAWVIRDARPAARRLLTPSARPATPRGWWHAATGVIGTTFAGPLLLFALAAALSLVLPRLVDPRVAIRELRTVILEPLIFYLLVIRFIRTRRQVEWLIDGLILSAAIVGRYGVEQLLLNRGVWEMDGVPRVSAFYPSATALGLYLGRVLPIAGALALLLPGGPRRIGYGVLCLPILAGVFLSWTRAAWIGDFAAFLVIVLLIGRRRLVGVFLTVTALAVAGLAVTRPERIVALFSAGEGTQVSRIRVWQAAVNVLRENPITGIGLDQFVHLDAARYGIPHVRFMLYSHPHNFILDFWLRLGLLGLVALTWLLVRFYRASARILRQARQLDDPYLPALLLGLIGSMTHFIVHGLFDLTYFQPDLAYLFWLTIGLVEVARRLTRAGASTG